MSLRTEGGLRPSPTLFLLDPRFVGGSTHVHKDYQNFAEFMDTHKATLSAWKVRKNRLPLTILQKICKMLDFDFSDSCKRIEECDRTIVRVKGLSNDFA